MINYDEQAAPLFIKAGTRLRAGAILNMPGDFYLQVGKNKKEIADLQAALNNYRLALNHNLQLVYNLLGNNYLMLNNYKKALKYALLALKTVEAVQPLAAC